MIQIIHHFQLYILLNFIHPLKIKMVHLVFLNEDLKLFLCLINLDK